MPKEKDIKGTRNQNQPEISTYSLSAPEARTQHAHRTSTFLEIYSTAQSSTHKQKLYQNSPIKKEIMPPLLLAQIPDLRKMFSHKIFIHTTISCNKSRQYSSTHKRFSQSGAHDSSRHIQHSTIIYKNDGSQTHTMHYMEHLDESQTVQRLRNLTICITYLYRNQPSAYIHKLLPFPSSSSTDIQQYTYNYSLLHHITLPEHTSDYDVLKGQRGRDDRPQAVAQHQH